MSNKAYYITFTYKAQTPGTILLCGKNEEEATELLKTRLLKDFDNVEIVQVQDIEEVDALRKQAVDRLQRELEMVEDALQQGRFDLDEEPKLN